MGPAPLRKVEREVSSPVTNSRQVLSAANDGNATTYIGKVSPTETTRPRDAAIRQAASENQSIRQVRTTTAPNTSYPTVDQEFADSYNEQSSMRPSVGEIMDYANDNPGRSGGVSSIRKPRTDHVPTTKGSSVMRNPSVQKSLVSGDKMKKLTRAHNLNDVASAALPGELGSYATAVEEASELVPALGTIWATFQLPMALACVAALTVAGIWQKAKDTVDSNVITATLANVASWTVNTVLDAATGITLEDLDPMNFLLLFMAVTTFIVWAQILIAAVTYAISGIPCLNGKGSTLKYATLIAALTFGFFPVINILPWALFWVLAVTANPTDDD